MIDNIRVLCRDLSPPDADRAITFNERAKEEEIISFNMFLEQGKLPRQIFIHGYQAMFNSAALFLAKKYKTKIDETVGGVHKNMRTVIDFYTRDSTHNPKLISLFDIAVDRFKAISQQYHSKHHFAKKVVKDLMYNGYNEGKKSSYYSEENDPLELTMADAKMFVENIVEPFLFIMEKLTND